MNNQKITTQKIFIACNEHANLDSLPLRFGFNFDTNQNVELKIFNVTPHENFTNRLVYDASIYSPMTNYYERGTFIVIQDEYNKTPKLVTAWRQNKDDEKYLSELMKNLRKDKLIDADWLKSKHYLYLNGTISKSSDILDILIQENAEIHRDKYEVLVDDLQTQISKEKSRADEAEKKYNDLFEKEQMKASKSGNRAVATVPEKLVEVKENTLHNNSLCTVLVMESGTKWYMKTSMFDQNLLVTRKAKTLINKSIRVTSWDPLRQPGRWSSLNYFRNVYAV
jgi:hypothetical protein